MYVGVETLYADAETRFAGPETLYQDAESLYRYAETCTEALKHCTLNHMPAWLRISLRCNLVLNQGASDEMSDHGSAAEYRPVLRRRRDGACPGASARASAPTDEDAASRVEFCHGDRSHQPGAQT